MNLGMFFSVLVVVVVAMRREDKSPDIVHYLVMNKTFDQQPYNHNEKDITYGRVREVIRFDAILL